MLKLRPESELSFTNRYFLNEDKMIFSKKIIFFFLTIGMFVSCQTLPEVPKGMIEVEKMTNILAEIHLAEAQLNKVMFQEYDSTKVAFRELEKRIFAKYQVDSATYRKTYNYYATEPELMLEVYKNIGPKLDNLQKEAEKLAKIKSKPHGKPAR